jgi:hypothetical protein
MKLPLHRQRRVFDVRAFNLVTDVGSKKQSIDSFCPASTQKMVE